MFARVFLSSRALPRSLVLRQAPLVSHRLEGFKFAAGVAFFLDNAAISLHPNYRLVVHEGHLWLASRVIVVREKNPKVVYADGNRSVAQ